MKQNTKEGIIVSIGGALLGASVTTMPSWIRAAFLVMGVCCLIKVMGKYSVKAH